MSHAYGLTPRQADCLAAIRRHLDEHGEPPTYERLCAELGLASKSAIARLVCALEQRGHVRRLPRLRQSIRLVDDSGAAGQGRAPAPAAPSPAGAPQGAGARPVEKRCTIPTCRASYVTTFANQERCWNCQVRALQAAKTPAWPVENNP